MYIDAPIYNSSGNRVGLHIRGQGPVTLGNNWNAVILGGSLSNTFTGETRISGKGTILSLNKINGATAIKGDTFLETGTGLSFWRGDQIADSAAVMMGKESSINLHGAPHERLHKIVVEGDSEIRFGQESGVWSHRFFLDDLLVKEGSTLKITEWKQMHDYLLVRKDSRHLYDALSRIKFEGREEHRAWVSDYDADYWQVIPAFPEPATYGAILGAMGLGCFVWRNKMRLSKEICR